MSGKSAFKMLISITILCLIPFLFVDTANGEERTLLTDIELAEKYAPVLYFHEQEVFRPQPVEVMLENAKLRQDRSFWFDLNILNSVVTSDLVTYRDASLFLDIWYGSARQSDYKNYSFHRAYYAENLSPEVGGLPATIYTSITRDSQNNQIVLQYWLFYYYNDWFNKHEGDWELIQIILNQDQTPEWVVLSQHHGGTRRAWEDTQIEEDTHPTVYVALGSHANYFWGDEVYPNSMTIGNKRVDILDRTGQSSRILPEVVYLPTVDKIISATDQYSSVAWLIFNGHWGELSLQGDFGGPSGPATKGDQWEHPYVWGLEQPLDVETWYQNRLSVFVEPVQTATFSIQPSTKISLNALDIGQNFLIYHQDPPSEVSLKINTDMQENGLLTAFWPDKENKVVTRYDYTGITTSPTDGDILLNFTKEGRSNLTVSGIVIPPTNQSTEEAIWDAPDLVWFAGYLPASQIALGLLTALAAGLLPGIFYVILIYHFDRYEKEPLKLVFTALLWGAIPSMLVGVLAQIFISLPLDLLDPKWILTIQSGVITPLTEEAIKGAILIFIATRHRKEFNDLLDGVVYGAIVGIGFAISGNIISYIGSFVVRGFQGLGVIILMEGFLSGLNHAFYSSIFGAGLAYYTNARKSRKTIWVPATAFFIAVLANGLHELLTSNLANLPVLGFVINWIGIITVVGIMILERRREKGTIQQYLTANTPPAVLSVLLQPKQRKTTLRELSQNKSRAYKKTLAKQINLMIKLAFAEKAHSRYQNEDLAQLVNHIKEQIQNLNRQTNFLDSSPKPDQEQSEP